MTHRLQPRRRPGRRWLSQLITDLIHRDRDRDRWAALAADGERLAGVATR